MRPQPYSVQIDVVRFADQNDCYRNRCTVPQLSVENLSRFEGADLLRSDFLESQLCTGDEVVIVGGANSAGQAAVFYRKPRNVYTCSFAPTACRTQCRVI